MALSSKPIIKPFRLTGFQWTKGSRLAIDWNPTRTWPIGAIEGAGNPISASRFSLALALALV